MGVLVYAAYFLLPPPKRSFAEVMFSVPLACLVCLFVCYQDYSKSYERISMKFSGKIEDGTSNKALNFGSILWPVCLSVSILLVNL